MTNHAKIASTKDPAQREGHAARRDPASGSDAAPPEAAPRSLAKIYGLGAVGGALVALALVGAPNAVEAYMSGNERAVIGDLKAIGAAQSLFRECDKEQDGELDYATLAELGATGLVDALLASGTKNGYVFEVSYGALTSEFLWFATARPLLPGLTGDRYFATNHEGVTYFTTQAPVAVDSVGCRVPQGAISHG